MPDAKIADSTRIYTGWTSLDRIALVMPDGAVVERHIEDHGGAVALLPYDPDRRTALLVSMPRAPVVRIGDPDLLEAIAGSLESDEDPEACACREALEEAGLDLDSLELVGRVWSMPGLSTERISLYLAPYSQASRIEAGGGAAGEHENIAVHEVPLAELWRSAAAGGLPDLKTLALLQALRIRSPALFADSDEG